MKTFSDYMKDSAQEKINYDSTRRQKNKNFLESLVEQPVYTSEEQRELIREHIAKGTRAIGLACDNCSTELYECGEYGFGGKKLGCAGCGWMTYDGKG